MKKIMVLLAGMIIASAPCAYAVEDNRIDDFQRRVLRGGLLTAAAGIFARRLPGPTRHAVQNIFRGAPIPGVIIPVRRFGRHMEQRGQQE